MERIMKRLSTAIAFTLAVLPLCAQVSFRTGDAELDRLLVTLDAEARADLGGFVAGLSLEFDFPQARIEAWLTVEKLEPAEAYLALDLARISGKPPAAVLDSYKSNRGRGWGAVARSLGVRPGSAQFQALKQGAGRQSEKARGRKK
jgi:hypothetical protein